MSIKTQFCFNLLNQKRFCFSYFLAGWSEYKLRECVLVFCVKVRLDQLLQCFQNKHRIPQKRKRNVNKPSCYYGNDSCLDNSIRTDKREDGGFSFILHLPQAPWYYTKLILNFYRDTVCLFYCRLASRCIPASLFFSSLVLSIIHHPYTAGISSADVIRHLQCESCEVSGALGISRGCESRPDISNPNPIKGAATALASRNQNDA